MYMQSHKSSVTPSFKHTMCHLVSAIPGSCCVFNIMCNIKTKENPRTYARNKIHIKSNDLEQWWIFTDI
jgi:hypothetical protein